MASNVKLPRRGVVNPCPNRSGMMHLVQRIGVAMGQWALRRFIRRSGPSLAFWITQLPTVASATASLVHADVFESMANGQRTTDEIALELSIHEPTLYRMLRALAGIRIVDQTGERQFALNDISICFLRRHPLSVREWLELTQLFWLESLTGLPTALQNGQPTVEVVFGKSCWEVGRDRPELILLHDTAMNRVTENIRSTLAESYDFSKFRTILDVGGGRGAFLCEVLRKAPQSRGIVYDRDACLTAAIARIEAEGMIDRCEFVVGDFLEPIPQQADAYILKHVLHDWDDNNVLRILKNVRQAIPKTGRLLIIEGGVEHDLQLGEFFRAVYDLGLLTSTFGKMRTLIEFESLLEQSGFTIDSVTPTTIVDALIIESTPVPK